MNNERTTNTMELWIEVEKGPVSRLKMFLLHLVSAICRRTDNFVIIYSFMAIDLIEMLFDFWLMKSTFTFKWTL